MKTSIMKQIRLWLPMMCATMMLTACSSDDSNADPKPEPQPEVKTIFYTATVGDATRATVADNNKDIYFATGDKLYISSSDAGYSDLKGTLELKSGAGTNHATFEGTLTYTSSAPTDATNLDATLVGSENVGVQITDGKVTGINYGTEICVAVGTSSAVNEAVKKYSYLTGTNTFGAHSFTLTQHTTFLNFTIKVSGTASGTSCAVSVNNVGGSTRTGNVTSETSGSDVVLKFVAPVAPQTLSNASVMVKNQYGIPFGGTANLSPKVYNVNKTININYEYVDLGLPSGTKWAKTNLGAATETEYGNFYAWGGTIGYSSSDATDHTFDKANAPYYSGSGDTYNKYTSQDGVLEASDDAATQSRGTAWHIPTKAQFEELISYTTKAKTLTGFRFTSNITGYTDKSIFLPAAGIRVNNNINNQNAGGGSYWTSTGMGHEYDTAPYSIGFFYNPEETPHIKQDVGRSNGMTIRPVYVP